MSITSAMPKLRLLVSLYYFTSGNTQTEIDYKKIFKKRIGTSADDSIYQITLTTATPRQIERAPYFKTQMTQLSSKPSI